MRETGVNDGIWRMAYLPMKVAERSRDSWMPDAALRCVLRRFSGDATFRTACSWTRARLPILWISLQPDLAAKEVVAPIAAWRTGARITRRFRTTSHRRHWLFRPVHSWPARGYHRHMPDHVLRRRFDRRDHPFEVGADLGHGSCRRTCEDFRITVAPGFEDAGERRAWHAQGVHREEVHRDVFVASGCKQHRGMPADAAIATDAMQESDCIRVPEAIRVEVAARRHVQHAVVLRQQVQPAAWTQH